MPTADTLPEAVARRPKRADARRNYDKVVAAARAAFAEEGGAASLEEIARRAGVGIATLYRNFPSRPDLLEAVYVEEVEAVCRSAEELLDAPPWDALIAWLHRFVGYMSTKEALSEELFRARGRDAEVFTGCRTAFYTAGGKLLARAQAGGDVRRDLSISDVVMMVAGISRIPSSTPEQVHRILDIAVEGLRQRPPG